MEGKTVFQASLTQISRTTHLKVFICRTVMGNIRSGWREKYISYLSAEFVDSSNGQNSR